MMNKESKTASTTSESRPDADGMYLRQWKTEIRDCLTELRNEIQEVRESLTSNGANHLAGKTSTSIEKGAVNIEPIAQGTLDRLETLKRRLNERLQSQSDQSADTETTHR